MLITEFINGNKAYQMKMEKLKVGEEYFVEIEHYINVGGNKMKSIWERATFKYITGINDKVLVFEKKYESNMIQHKSLITMNTLDYLSGGYDILTPAEYYEREKNN